MKKVIFGIVVFIIGMVLIYGNGNNVKAYVNEENIVLENVNGLYSYTFCGVTYTSNISMDDAFKSAIVDQYNQGLKTIDEIELEYGLYTEPVLNYIDTNSDDTNSNNEEEEGIKVHLEWQPTVNAKYIPLKFMKVQLIYMYYGIDNPITYIVLEEGYTDENGDYVFQKKSNWLNLIAPFLDVINGIEVCVRVFPESRTFKVQQDYLNVMDLGMILDCIPKLVSYNVISKKINVGLFDSNGDFGTIQIPYGNKLDEKENLTFENMLRRSFHVAQALAMGQSFIDEQEINIENKLNVAYPALVGTLDQTAFCYFDYTLGAGLMCIGKESDGWHTILHEYGHFIQGSLDLFPFSLKDYLNYFEFFKGILLGQNTGVDPYHEGDEDHISDPKLGKGKEIGIKFAWSEAWAYSFAYIVQDYYWNGYYVEGEDIDDTGLEEVERLQITFFYGAQNRCEGQEEAIIVFLNNIYNSFDNGLEVFLTSITPQKYLEKKKQTLSIYVNNIMEKYPDYHKVIGDILVNCHLASELISVSSYETYVSPTLSFYPYGSQYNPLNQIQFAFYDKNGEEKYITNSYNILLEYNEKSEFTIPYNEWLLALEALGDSSTFEIEIISYNTTDFTTGPYIGNRITLNTPYFFDLSFDEENDGYVISDIYNIGDNETIFIPEYFNGKEVIGISDNAFEGCINLFEINIPKTVKSIGDEAFKNCTSLNNVTIERENNEITKLGINAFSACYNLEKINVSNNQVLKYKNADNWKYYKNKIVFDDIYDENYMDCENPLSLDSISILKDYNSIIKINAACAKSYKFVFESDYEMDAEIYNFNYVTLNSSIIYNSNNNTYELTIYLSKGIYYLEVYFVSKDASGLLNFTVNVTWPTTSYNLEIGENNVLNHLHKNEDGKYENYLIFDYDNPGFYMFNLIITDIEGIVETPVDSLKIFMDDNKTYILPQYFFLNNGTTATNQNEQLLSYIDNAYGYVFINIVLESNEYISVRLIIEEVDEKTLNIYNLESLNNVNVINSVNNECSDYMKKVTLKQLGNFKVSYTGLLGGSFIIVKEKHIVDDYIEYIVLYNQELNDLNENIILEEGIYYIGYINAEYSEVNSFKFIRLIDSSPNTVIYSNGGTEVTINGGNNNSNTITQGFTRLLYFTNGESRLNYCWYTNNETASRITETGTLMALSVSSDVLVKIMAINKKNPSFIIQQEFLVKYETIREVTNIIEASKCIVFNPQVQLYVQIDLSELNVPINWLQYYTWSSSNSRIEVDQFGRITASNNISEGIYIITGYYKLNPRFVIKIPIEII